MFNFNDIDLTINDRGPVAYGFLNVARRTARKIVNELGMPLCYLVSVKKVPSTI